MKLEFGPILRSLKSHKVVTLLIALQVAATMAVMANGLFIIMERKAFVNRDTGYDIENIFFITNYVYDDSVNTNTIMTEDLERINQVPSVVAATPINAIPISGVGSWFRIRHNADEEAEPFSVGYYDVNENGLSALGLDLIAGENFTKEDIFPPVHEAADIPKFVNHIITSALADMLFPQIPYEEVIGKRINYEHTLEAGIIVKGIVKKMHTPWINDAAVERNILTPVFNDGPRFHYAVRVEPNLIDSTMDLVYNSLVSSQPNRIIEEVKKLSTVHEQAYQEDSGLVNTLVIVITGLSAITMFGIIGLTHFSVSARQKQIGTRRALGASKTDILRYFFIEIVFISLTGIILGIVGTLILNMVLVNHFSMEKIDWVYIPISTICMLLIGIFGVFGPAQRASLISPAMATRG